MMMTTLALLRGTFPENNATGPTPPHVTIRDALMNLVEKRRGRVYIVCIMMGHSMKQDPYFLISELSHPSQSFQWVPK